MAIVTPQSDLVLLKCPLEVDQQNQLTFSNATAQYNYFNSLPKLAVNDFTYQRKDGTVRFPAQIDDIRSYNYCMYRNDAYSNKWFYAFITDMQYANDGVTQISLKTDVWQTWCLNITVKASFVEREHVNNDAIGANTLDEGLPTGEPIMNGFQEWIVASNDDDTQRMVAQVTQLPDGVDVPSGYTNRVYNGIPQGCYFCIFNSAGNFAKFSQWYDKKGQQNAITSLFLVPTNMVANAHYENFDIGEDVGSTRVGFLPASYTAWNMDLSTKPAITYSSTLDGYTPKNKKMYCFPYSYLYVSNNAGADIVYHYEDWQDPTTPYFYVRGTLGQGCSIQLYPYAYKKQSLTSGYGAYGVSCGKLPLISWTSDYYLNWQAQNGVNNVVRGGVGAVSGLAQGVGGLATIALSSGDAGLVSGVTQTIGGAANMVSSIADAMHEDHIAGLVPDQARGNTNCADLTYAMDKCGFTFRKMSCRREYAEMIDQFFTMFGYKVNKVKTPNVTGRRYWNYVKCVQANIVGDIPQDDMNEIKSYFNAGITFWHDATKYLDYSQNNAIV